MDALKRSLANEKQAAPAAKARETGKAKGKKPRKAASRPARNAAADLAAAASAPPRRR